MIIHMFPVKPLPVYYHFEKKNLMQNLASALTACETLTNAQLLQLPATLLKQVDSSTRNELLAAITYLTEKRGLNK